MIPAAIPESYHAVIEPVEAVESQPPQADGLDAIVRGPMCCLSPWCVALLLLLAYLAHMSVSVWFMVVTPFCCAIPVLIAFALSQEFCLILLLILLLARTPLEASYFANQDLEEARSLLMGLSFVLLSVWILLAVVLLGVLIFGSMAGSSGLWFMTLIGVIISAQTFRFAEQLQIY